MFIGLSLLVFLKEFIAAYPNHIINIHPALLPGFGGAGMYGKFVHQAVFNSKAKFSGITIHLVNEEYDKGQLLYQHAVALSEEESPESIEQKVRSLELKHFAEDLESYIVK
jgi:phosphoribosylglycinamide formyltransferase-1